jgi:hypothetical protein
MKEKLLSVVHWLKNPNIPSLGFIAVTSHIVIKGAAIGDALALMAISGLYGYQLYLKHSEQAISETVAIQVSELKKDISSLKLKTIQTPSVNKAEPKRFF